MLLDPHDVQLFFKLQRALWFFVNQRLNVLPQALAAPDALASIPPPERLKLRDAFLSHTELLEPFLKENPVKLSGAELDIVRSWRHFVQGSFLVLREQKKHTVFLATSNPPVAYGVVALAQPFEELIGPSLPVMVETVLLPFKDVIVYDGMLNRLNISLGPGIVRSLNESFKQAKSRHGIVTTLPMSDQPLPRKTPKPRSAPKSLSNELTDDALREILGVIEPFCKTHLNAEYAELCRKLATKLARKRPSPLLRGNLNAWASGIVRAVGGANFLHDKSQKPYLRATDIDYYLNTSPASGAAKAAEIRKLFRIRQFDHN